MCSGIPLLMCDVRKLPGDGGITGSWRIGLFYLSVFLALGSMFACAAA